MENYILCAINLVLTGLQFNHSPDDIVMDAHDPLYYESETSVKPERRSFRAYSAVLYYDPRMKIFIQVR